MSHGGQPRPLYCFNGGFFTQKTVRRILDLSGYDVSFGKPGPDDLIGVWGKSPTSARGESVASHTGANVVHIEDALLRSVESGRSGDAPVGLTIDTQRPFFDSSGPSDLEDILAKTAFDDAAQLTRAKQAIEELRRVNLSKYNDFPIDIDVPEPGYVLVIDQTRDDASVTYGGGNVGTFREMLVFAQEEHRGARIIVKAHPDTMAGRRNGHFDESHMGPNIELFDKPVSPYALLDGAIAVYTVSSGMGFEAIIAGHKPIVFGQPFYAGWGLTDDRQPIDRRQRKLTRAQLFVGAMMMYPKWYSPSDDRLCEIEEVITHLTALARARREDKAGYSALGMSAWKRPHMKAFFGDGVSFVKTPSPEKKTLVWGAKHPEIKEALRIEDGFIRSQGLGADLIAPMSLVVDDLGLYFDASRPSRLENMIASSCKLSGFQLARAEKLRGTLIRHAVTKYNLDGAAFDVPDDRETILVVGQVEDDASIKLGCVDARTNDALLAKVRHDFPEAFVIYKPHPDVEAGLRPGGEVNEGNADLIATKAEGTALIAQVDRVATMTSLMGFEALLRGKTVSCYGIPFYAGWGLTDDRVLMPDRRRQKITLDGLVHAALIDYPRYFDPVTQTACAVETVVKRLISGEFPKGTPRNRLLAKIQAVFAPFAKVWR